MWQVPRKRFLWFNSVQMLSLTFVKRRKRLCFRPLVKSQSISAHGLWLPGIGSQRNFRRERFTLSLHFILTAPPSPHGTDTSCRVIPLLQQFKGLGSPSCDAAGRQRAMPGARGESRIPGRTDRAARAGRGSRSPRLPVRRMNPPTLSGRGRRLR